MFKKLAKIIAIRTRNTAINPYDAEHVTLQKLTIKFNTIRDRMINIDEIK